jgi:arylsulfatase A-like enzyme
MQQPAGRPVVLRYDDKMELTMMKALILAVTALLCAGSGAQTNNLLLIIADDIGLDSLRFSNDDPAASYPPIPAIQHMAEHGVIFSNGYAYPTCSPTRSSILTGRYGYRTGVLSPQSSGSFSADEYTIPEVFADQGLGYAMASFGKWHLGGGNDGPNVLGGWPHFAGSLSGGLPNYRNWTKVVNGVSTNVTMAYATRENVTDAIGWINAQGTNRWFAWIGFNAAHTPLHKPPNNLHSYDYLTGDSADISSNPRPYFEAMTEAMDHQVGRLLGQVDTNDTTVIFIGDNGTPNNVIQPPYDIGGRAKGSLYEGGTHVPFLAYGAGIVDGGRTNASVVHCADLFATLIELAGGTPPATGQDSRSLLPILQNEPFAPAEDCILAETDSLPGAGDEGRAIRNEQYKLIRIDGADDGFYDLLADSLESTNLLSLAMTPVQADAYDALSGKLTAWTNAVPPVDVYLPTNRYAIVDTGQTGYYNADSGAAEPGPGEAFYGQDATYNGHQPSYTLSGDSLTVYDHITGLTWTQSPDLNGDGNIDVNDKLTQSQAAAYTAALNATNFGGYSDWRLPSIREIYSLMDFRGTDPMSDDTSTLRPFIETNVFSFGYGDTGSGERTIDAQFATTTIYEDLVMTGQQAMFGLNLADGRIKGYPVNSDFYVLFCRGNTNYGVNQFTDNSDGTVTDLATGLMWQQADSGVGYDWSNALAYCEGMELAGYRDWRLPNAKELHSILDYTRSPGSSGTAAIDTNFFSCTQITNEGGQPDYPWYYTGTTHLRQDGSARAAVYLCFGRATGYFMGSWLDVHGAGAQRSENKVFDTAGYTYVPDGYYFTISPQGDAARFYNFVRCVRGGAAGPQDDADEDGLTDAYEFNYAGSITGMVAAADDDGDGASNIEEQIAGTIPAEAASLLQFSQTAILSNGWMAVNWSSELDRAYRITASTNLTADAFSSVVASNLPATPPQNAYAVDDLSEINRFFRIEVE